MAKLVTWSKFRIGTRWAGTVMFVAGWWEWTWGMEICDIASASVVPLLTKCMVALNGPTVGVKMLELCCTDSADTVKESSVGFRNCKLTKDIVDALIPSWAIFGIATYTLMEMSVG
jgi:hypothetical protein